jgi:hypothetical protein
VGAAGSVERAVSGELFLIRLSDTIQDQIIIVDPQSCGVVEVVGGPPLMTAAAENRCSTTQQHAPSKTCAAAVQVDGGARRTSARSSVNTAS